MSTSTKEIVLITGANTGIGLEIARVLLRDHPSRFYCLIGTRTPSKGESAVQELHSQNLKDCEVLEIDVTSDESIAQAAKKVEEKFGRLDVLHVNAGHAPEKELIPTGHSISSVLMTTLHTNVAGASQTVEAFTPLLQTSSNARVIFTSSGLGSLSTHSNPESNNKWPTYSASKAALNMMMLYYRKRFPGWRVNASCPGFRATALNAFGSAQPDITPGKTEDGALNSVRLSLLGEDGETGTYTRRNDQTGEIMNLPW